MNMLQKIWLILTHRGKGRGTDVLKTHTYLVPQSEGVFLPPFEKTLTVESQIGGPWLQIPVDEAERAAKTMELLGGAGSGGGAPGPKSEVIYGRDNRYLIKIETYSNGKKLAYRNTRWDSDPDVNSNQAHTHLEIGDE